MLNLYLRDDHKDKISIKDRNEIDASFGSSLFAVKVHTPNSYRTDDRYTKLPHYDECTYILDYEAKTANRLKNAIVAMNKNLDSVGDNGMNKELLESLSGLLYNLDLNKQQY